MSRPDHAALIREFRAHPEVGVCCTRDGAYDKCRYISVNFVALARQRGLRARLWRVVMRPRWTRHLHPDIPVHLYGSHYVAQVEHQFYDWTARQFDVRLAFPLCYARASQSPIEMADWDEDYLLDDKSEQDGGWYVAINWDETVDPEFKTTAPRTRVHTRGIPRLDFEAVA